MGSGELILSGTDTFGGLVVIDGGNLVVTSSGSIDNGGSGTTVGSVNNHSIVELFGSMTTAGATIGFSNDNSVTVSGLGSLWSMTGDLQLGSNTGSDNSLNVVNGGAVNVGGNLEIGQTATTSDGNTLLIDGTNSLLMATNAFIGNSGINNSVTLTNNGVLRADTLFIGTFPSAVATLNIGNGGVPGSVVANGIVGGPGVAYIFFNHTANPYLFSVPI